MASIRILYDGKLALTMKQAAERYGLKPDAMRQAVLRLKRVGTVTELPEALDGSTKLYAATQLDRAMKRRPRRAVNVGKQLDEAPVVPQVVELAERSSYSEARPYVVADNLDDLHGPTSGTVALPKHLDWSGGPQRDLSAPHELPTMYATVLVEAATVGDLNAWLDRDKLVELWSAMFLPAKVRRLWEDRFPELAPTQKTPDHQ